MPTPFFSTDNHFRHSHHLQHSKPETLAPPSSFGRSGLPSTGSIRRSLRKIPSSLFVRSEEKDKKEKPVVKKDKFQVLLDKIDHSHASGPVKHTGISTKPLPSTLMAQLHPPSNIPSQHEAKPKKTKARKALADIISWGHQNKQTAKLPTIAKAPAFSKATAIPVNSEPSKKPNPAPSMKSSYSGLSGWSSLKPSTDTVAEAVRRPSLGEDPFGRRGEGAEVVEHVSRHGQGGRPASVKTFGTDRTERIPPKASLPFHDANPKRVSQPTQILDTPLVQLPPTSASLGRVLHPTRMQPVSPVSPMRPEERTLKKEKTKSKVWGFLGGGKKKEKEDVKRAEAFDPFGSTHTVAASTYRTTAVPAVPIASTIRSAQRTSTIRSDDTSTLPQERPRPPVLHISRPSTESSVQIITASTASPATARTITFKPDVSPTNSPFPAAEPRVWETVVGSYSDRPSVEGPRQVVAALMGPRGVPKRKSLTGLFGVAIKRSMEKIKPSPPNTFSKQETPVPMRSLAEELEDAHESPDAQVGSAFKSRFGKEQYEIDILESDELEHVASATDKLFNLVSCLDFSPSPSNSSPHAPSLGQMASLTSLKDTPNGSPTPMRRIRSAMLSQKPSGSPLRSVSPLKLAIKQARAANNKQTSTSPSHEKSLVKKGMRNIFAPPTPERMTPGSIMRGDEETVGMPSFCNQTFGDVSLDEEIFGSSSPIEVDYESDVPEELKDVFKDFEGDLSAAPSPHRLLASTLGLPPLPPAGRVSPKRRPALPALALPPLPPAPKIMLEVADNEHPRDSVFSSATGLRDSFDFTNEYSKLDNGDHRASFVEALHKVASSQMLVTDHGFDLPLFPGDTSAASDHIGLDLTTRSTATGETDMRDVSHLLEPPDESSVFVKDETGPFKGQAAFQQRVSQVKESNQQAFTFHPNDPINFDPPHSRRRGHRRDQSGFSISSMSTIGAVIETGIAGDYTNYFEVAFGQATATSTNNGNPRAPTRRAHHRRNSSILSVDSIGSLDLTSVSNGPPVSIFNHRRSHVSRRSVDSSRGRPDWAAHRRNSSSADSSSSAVSFNRIGRPGIGDRMFQLDGGVQLTSITGSPPDDSALNSNRTSRLETDDDRDSIFDSPKTTIDSIFDRSASISSDSIFGNSDEGLHVPQGFIIRGLRPISMVSTSSSAENPDDTFINVSKYAKNTMPKIKESPCLQGQGEDTTLMTPAASASSTGRQLLSDSIQRPAKPKSANRRRPAQLVFEPTPPTPVLSSPSASETSSRMSLDTKFSEPRARPHGAGHHRQKSSAGVHVHATIKEEASMATLRPKREEVEVVGWDAEDNGQQELRAWLQWEREANDEFRRMRSCWEDSEASKFAVAGGSKLYSQGHLLTPPSDFDVPMTREGIEAFLARSNQIYKPLEQLPAGGRMTHRRIPSLSNSRMNSSPYGLPLPPKNLPIKNKKGSLITKFERTNSATSSTFGLDDEPHSARLPPSAVFAQFARELPPSPPPKLQTPFVPFSPFNLPALSDFTVKKPAAGTEKEKEKEKEKSKRSRVTSSARRQALGWGRRRGNSDGDSEPINGLSKFAPPVPSVQLHSTANKENKVNPS
ncbi:hypothetical protein P7C73_g3889, partial [Tremellales sp. Uapishka_1]